MKSRIARVLVGFLPVTASGNGARILKFLQEMRYPGLRNVVAFWR